MSEKNEFSDHGGWFRLSERALATESALVRIFRDRYGAKRGRARQEFGAMDPRNAREPSYWTSRISQLLLPRLHRPKEMSVR